MWLGRSIILKELSLTCKIPLKEQRPPVTFFFPNLQRLLKGTVFFIRYFPKKVPTFQTRLLHKNRLKVNYAKTSILRLFLVENKWSLFFNKRRYNYNLLKDIWLQDIIVPCRLKLFKQFIMFTPENVYQYKNIFHPSSIIHKITFCSINCDQYYDNILPSTYLLIWSHAKK